MVNVQVAFILEIIALFNILSNKKTNSLRIVIPYHHFNILSDMKFQNHAYQTFLFVLLSIVLLFNSCGKGDLSVQEAYKLIPVQLKKDGKISLMDFDGKIVLEDEFSAESSVFYAEGIVIEHKKDRKVVYHKIKGKKSEQINDTKYSDGTPFVNGYALVKKDNGMLALIDDEGKEKISNLSKIENYTVVRAGVVSDDLIRFKTDEGLWGYADLGGKVVIKPTFTACENFNDGTARVKNSDGIVQIINKSGEVKFKGKDKFNYLPLAEGLIAFKENSSEKDYYGFMNMAGEKIIKDNKYSRCSYFKSGLATVRGDESDSWGVINQTGEIVGELKTKFEEEPFISHFGSVFVNNRKDKKCKIYNSKGELKKEIEDYQYIFPLTEERYIAVQKSDKLVIINNEGKEVSKDAFYSEGADFFRAMANNIDYKNNLSLASSYFDFEPLFKDIFREVSLTGMMGVTASNTPAQVLNTWPYTTPASMSGSGSKWVDRSDEYELEMRSSSKTENEDAPKPIETSDPYGDAPVPAADTTKVEYDYTSSINDPYSFISSYSYSFSPQQRSSGGLSYNLSFYFDRYLKTPTMGTDSYGYSTITGYQLNPDAKLSTMSCSFNFSGIDGESFMSQLEKKIISAGWQKNGDGEFSNNSNSNRIRMSSYSITMIFPSATEAVY